MRKKRDPLVQRRGQIEREIAKLHSPKNRKSRNDFKTDEAFANWQQTSQVKLDELYEESSILDFPEGYDEVPLAVAAVELDLGLSDMESIVAEGLIEASFEGHFSAGSRISRDELGRVIETGPGELLRRAQMEIPEIFLRAVAAFKEGNAAAARSAYERIERKDSCINPCALACEAGLQFLGERLQELQSTIDFIADRDFEDLPITLHALKSVLEAITPGSHTLSVVRQQLLAVANGEKDVPFRKTYSTDKATKFPSQMNENQNLSILLGDAVVESIKKYKFVKSIQSRGSYLTEPKEEELTRVVQNAIYTALEAYQSYNKSPSSKLYIDRLTDLNPKRRLPPELVSQVSHGEP
jgi:hypothetical protein